MSASTTAIRTPQTIGEVIRAQAINPVFQPIVDLDEDRVLGYEALARGPRGSAFETPAGLFSAAAREGVLGDLDRACREAAIAAALDGGLHPPQTLFLNVEPATLGEGPLLAHEDEIAGGAVRIIVEFTERALASRPAEVLAAVDWLREHGCGIALDDVGADERSLALLPFLAPDVIKLDMRLIQQRETTRESARVLNAVAAAAEETGATLLAEGIETDAHLLRARAVGARLGQGWLLGKPGPLPEVADDARESATPISFQSSRTERDGTPFELIADERRLRRGDKRLLLALSRQLEAEGEILGPEAVVLATFQDARFFSFRSARRYERLASRCALVAALGAEIDSEPAPGVRGALIDAHSPLHGEWDVIVISPHFAGAFVARDLGDTGIDSARRFDFFVTYDRTLVMRAARSLMAGVQPRFEDV